MKGKPPLTSSELGTLWIVYQKKTLMVQVIEYFLSYSEDAEARKILQSFYKTEKDFVNEISQLFKQEGAAVPIGFTENDVNHKAPRLFDNYFDVIYLRMMMKIASGIHALHLSMSYRDDIISLYRRFSSFAEETLEKATQFLLRKGAITKPPDVTLPEHVDFAQKQNYRTGFNPFNKKRSLNTVEVAYVYQAIEANVAGMKLMIGFAQVAKEKEVQKYFFRGKELSKTIIERLSKILLDQDIIVPTQAAGHVLDSTMPPFSDKLMMYNTSILTSFGLGNNAIGSSFSLRKDLPVNMIALTKDIFEFASEGGDLMIKHGWTEEPPQMEDRTELINKKD